MQENHNPITQERCRDLLTNAIPDMTLRMVIGHMQTIYDKYTLIDMLLSRGFKSSELIHDFGFSESHVKIVLRRSLTFGYTAYTPLGTVASRIPWADYMLHDDNNIMFLHGLTVKQFATLPVCPERTINHILYRQLNHEMTFNSIIKLLQSTNITKLWFENVNVQSIAPNVIPIGKTAISMLSDYGVQSAYDIIMLRDEEINEIFDTDVNLAEHFRKQTIHSMILLGTSIMSICAWSDDAASHILATHDKTAYDLYHHNRLGWLKHMPDYVQNEIQQNLDTFIQKINSLFESEQEDTNA